MKEPATKKRPSSAIDPSDIILPGEEEGELEIDESCDQVRRKITAFINSGAMKVTEFQRTIGVSAGSYGNFMKQHGPNDGFGNGTYPAAWEFFKKRELAGVKMPAKKRKTSGSSKKDGGNDEYDVSTIHLDGEEDESVEIYDTCGEIRRKIAAHLRAAGVTQASFLRALSTSFPEDNPRKIGSKQLKDFTSKKGPMAGSSSGVFYASYVYFEKLRIKQGKKKGKKRVEMEEQWGGKGGFPRTGEVRWTCRVNERPVMDQYGVTSIQRVR